MLGNAGTAMRPLVAALALGAGGAARFELRGTPRMHERPIGDLVDALRALGCAIEYLERPGFPPLVVRAARGRARGRQADRRARRRLEPVPDRAAARAAAARRAGRRRQSRSAGELISKPYVDITLQPARALRRRRSRATAGGAFSVAAPTGTASRRARFVVEGDASSASYFIAAGAIAATDRPLRIEGVGSDSIQGDIAFVDAVRAMGATIDRGTARARGPARPLGRSRRSMLDCNHIPDAAMTLAALALFADGTSRLDATSPAGASRRPTGWRR